MVDHLFHQRRHRILRRLAVQVTTGGSRRGRGIGNLAGMASSIAMMVSFGSLVELYLWAYQGTIRSATSSLIGIIATIV